MLFDIIRCFFSIGWIKQLISWVASGPQSTATRPEKTAAAQIYLLPANRMKYVAKERENEDSNDKEGNSQGGVNEGKKAEGSESQAARRRRGHDFFRVFYSKEGETSVPRCSDPTKLFRLQ